MSSDYIGRLVIIYLPALPSVQLQRRFERFLVNAADEDHVY